MTEKKETLQQTLNHYHELGIDKQIDYDKFYLYSIITHSTAIEGSTVTEIENQLLFDEGITAKGRTLVEVMMNLDLKAAYEQAMQMAIHHADLSVETLCRLSAIVMKNTGSIYHTALGDFSSANGDLRLLNVTAGIGGRSYLSYQKVPAALEQFCQTLNERRKQVKTWWEAYQLSFDAHYELVTIHPWADGNGRMSRLIMNYIQFEFGLIPMRVLKEQKLDYIDALNQTRDKEDLSIFRKVMTDLHIANLRQEITAFEREEKKGGQKTSKGGQKNSKGGQKTSERILTYLASNPKASRKELSEQMSIAQSAIQKHLKALQLQGLLVRIGPNKGGYWEVVQNVI